MRQLLLRGIEFYVHDDEALSNAMVRKADFWEAEILDYLAFAHPKQKTILDIGANIGNHSVYFANYLDYEEIVAFEPDCENYALLAVNMENYDNVGLIHMAVSDHTGTLKMTKNHANWGAHEVDEEGTEHVHCVALDKVVFDDVSLIKIDAEWHEPQIIEGATDTLIRHRPLVLIEDVKLEYHALLEPLGYELEHEWPLESTYLWRYS